MLLGLAVKKSAQALIKTIPIFLGTILLISIITTVIPQSFYTNVLSHGSIFLNSFLGGLVGSISAGSPIISYIIGGELLKQNISLVVVTAFLLTWVTVGIVQIPAEIKFFGKKFTILRNLFAFIFALVISPIIVLLYNIFS